MNVDTVESYLTILKNRYSRPWDLRVYSEELQETPGNYGGSSEEQFSLCFGNSTSAGLYKLSSFTSRKVNGRLELRILCRCISDMRPKASIPLH